MKYMFDTNICIYLIKKKPESVLTKFKKLKAGDVSISSITLAELAYGVEKSTQQEKNLTALNGFILPIEIALFDEKAAFHYGKIRSELEKKGTPIGAMDLLIAAHAQSEKMTLITNNVKEFSRIPKLKIENWV